MSRARKRSYRRPDAAGRLSVDELRRRRLDQAGIDAAGEDGAAFQKRLGLFVIRP